MGIIFAISTTEKERNGHENFSDREVLFLILEIDFPRGEIILILGTGMSVERAFDCLLFLMTVCLERVQFIIE